MQLKPSERVRIDPETGEFLDSAIEPRSTPSYRRRVSRPRRGPWHWPDGHHHGSVSRPLKRYALSGHSMDALFLKAVAPPPGVPAGELVTLPIKGPVAKDQIADAQLRSVNFRHLKWRLCGDCASPRHVIWQSGGHLLGRLPL